MEDDMRNKITITNATTTDDLQGILKLQRANLKQQLSEEEQHTQGFVTVVHNLETLQQISGPHQHIIAKNPKGEVVGYTLVMLRDFRASLPILQALFARLDNLTYRGQPLAEIRYVVMGQVCIAKAYRGQGIFAALYHLMAASLREDFTYIITEISHRNPRSMAAHAKLGFETILEYQAESGEDWRIVLWSIS